MTYFLLIALLLTLMPQEQTLPSEFYELPESVTEQSTLIVAGTYAEGRSPCILMADGIRAWTMISSIRVSKVYRGEAKGKYIYLSWGALLKTKKLTRGQSYLVLLRPNEKSMKAIRAGDYVSVWDALDEEEIVAIVEVIK